MSLPYQEKMDEYMRSYKEWKDHFEDLQKLFKEGLESKLEKSEDPVSVLILGGGKKVAEIPRDWFISQYQTGRIGKIILADFTDNILKEARGTLEEMGIDPKDVETRKIDLTFSLGDHVMQEIDQILEESKTLQEFLEKFRALDIKGLEGYANRFYLDREEEIPAADFTSFLMTASFLGKVPIQGVIEKLRERFPELNTSELLSATAAPEADSVKASLGTANIPLELKEAIEEKLVEFNHLVTKLSLEKVIRGLMREDGHLVFANQTMREDTDETSGEKIVTLRLPLSRIESILEEMIREIDVLEQRKWDWDLGNTEVERGEPLEKRNIRHVNRVDSHIIRKRPAVRTTIV